MSASGERNNNNGLELHDWFFSLIAMEVDGYFRLIFFVNTAIKNAGAKADLSGPHRDADRFLYTPTLAPSESFKSSYSGMVPSSV
jgi:hypothetical protein